MKTIVSVIRSGVLAVILASPMMTFAESTSTGGVSIERMVGKVVYIVGQAELETKDGTRKPLVRNMSIPEGSHLVVKERSKVNLQMQDGETRQLEANTKWDINVFQYDPAHPEDSLVRTTLKEGEVTTKTGQAGHDAPDQYRLNTPIAAIGVLGTEYTVRVKNGETIVILRQGIVSVGRFSADCTRDSYGPCSGDSSVRLTEQQRGLAAVVREDQPKPIIMPAPQALRGTTTATTVAKVKSDPKKEETASNSNTSKTETKKSEEEGKSTTTASSSNSKSNSQTSNSADTTTAKTTASDEGKKTSSSTATAEETTTATADTSNSKTTTSASSSTSKSSVSSATDGTTTANSTTVASSSTDATTKAASESEQPLSSASTNTASGSKSAATETSSTVASSSTPTTSKTSSTDLVDELTTVATVDSSAKSSTSSATSSTSLSSNLATTSAAKASTQTTDLVDALTTVAAVDKSSASSATSSSTASSSTLVSASTIPSVAATVTPVTASLSASTTAALAASESASNSLTSANVAKPLATTTATDLVESVKTDAITTLAANTTLPTTPVLESNTDLTNNTKDTIDIPTTPTTNPVVKWSKYDPSALVVSSGTMTDQVNSLYEKLTMTNASDYETQRLKDASVDINQPQDVKLKMGSYEANVTNAKTGLTANATIKDDASLTLSPVNKTYNAQFTVESGLLAAPAAITSKGSYDTKGILQDDGTNAGTTFQGAFGVKGTAVDAATNFQRQIDPDLKANGAMNWSGTLDTSTSTPVTGLVTP